MTLWARCFLVACLAVGTAEAQTGLAVSPSSFSFSVDASSKTVQTDTLKITNTGAAVTFTITSSDAWLTTSPLSGPLAANGSSSVTVRANPAGLTAGSHIGTLTVSASGRVAKSVTVTLQLTGLIISTDEVDLSANAGSKTVVTDFVKITNNGGAVNYTITSNQPWLTTSPSNGAIGANGSVDVTVRANPTGLEASSKLYVGTLTITAPGRPTLPVTVKFQISGAALTLNPNSWTLTLAANRTATMNFSVGQVEGSGDGIQVSSGQSWLKVNKTTGNTPVTITATVDTTGLTQPSYQGTIAITSTDAPAIPKAFSVVLTVNTVTDLQVSPAAMTLTGNPTTSSIGADSKPVTVQNTGPQITFTATPDQPWIVVGASSGSGTSTYSAGVAADGQATFFISAVPRNLDVGIYHGNVQVSAPGRPTRAVAVTLNIVGVSITLNPSTVNIDAAPNSTGTGTFTTATLDGTSAQIDVSAPAVNWLTVNPSQTTTGQTITLTAKTTGLAAGSQLTTLSVTPAGGLPRALTVNLNVRAAVTISAVPSSLQFNSLSATLPMTIQSSGAPVTFSAVGSQPWVQVTPSRGATPLTLTVSINQAAFNASATSAFVVITPDNGSAGTLSLPVSYLSPLTQKRYTIPQIADGGAFQTSIILVNTGSSDTTASVRFYRTDLVSHATVPWNPVIADNASTQNVTISPATSYTIQTAGQDSGTTSGWAEVASSGPIDGFAVFRQRIGTSDQEAAVPINVDGVQRFWLPYDNLQGYTTSMALLNLSTTDSAPVSVTFRGAGQVRTEALGTIPPLGQWPFELEGEYSYLDGDRGVAEFSSTSGQLSALGLRFNPSQAFTSFEAQTARTAALNRYSIPQIADGGAFQTSITLVNTGTSSITVNLKFYRSAPDTHATQTWNLAFVGNASTQNVTIASGTSYILQTAGTDSTTTSGWSEVVSSGPLNGFAVFRQRMGNSDQEAAVPVNLDGSQRLLLPYDNQQGYTTSIAVVNLSTTDAANVNVTFRSTNGQVRQALLGTIPPMGHWPLNLPSQFSYLSGDRGVADFTTSTGSLSMLGLRFNPSQAFTSFRALVPVP